MSNSDFCKTQILCMNEILQDNTTNTNMPFRAKVNNSINYREFKENFDMYNINSCNIRNQTHDSRFNDSDLKLSRSTFVSQSNRNKEQMRCNSSHENQTQDNQIAYHQYVQSVMTDENKYLKTQIQHLVNYSQRINIEMAERQSKIDNLTNENRILLECKDRRNKEQAEHQNEINTLSNQIRDLQKEHQDLILSYDKQNEQHQILSVEVEEFRKQNMETEQSRQMTEKSEILEKDNLQLKQKIEKYSSDLQDEDHQMNYMIDKVEKLMQVIGKYQQTFQKIFMILDIQTMPLNDCGTDLGEVFKKIEKVIYLLLYKQYQITQQSIQIKQRSKTLTNVIQKQDYDYGQKISHLEEKLNNSNAILSQFQSEIQQNVSTIDALKYIINNQKSEVFKINNQKSELNKIDQMKDQINVLCKQNLQLNETVVHLQAEDECSQFFIENMRTFIFNKDNFQFIKNIQITKCQIVKMQMNKNEQKHQEFELRKLEQQLAQEMIQLTEQNKLELQKYQWREYKEHQATSKELDYPSKEKRQTKRSGIGYSFSIEGDKKSKQSSQLLSQFLSVNTSKQLNNSYVEIDSRKDRI